MIPYGYVYRIRNKINAKTYVGQRKLSLDKSWRHYMGSGVALKAAISNYGIENFTKEFLVYAFSYVELNQLEDSLILEEKSQGKSEYNLHYGSPYPTGIKFSRMSEDEVRKRKAEIKSSRISRNQIEFEEFSMTYGNEILSHYAELKSCAKVAKELKLSLKRVNRFLKEKNVLLNHQNAAGRKMPREVKDKIRASVKSSTKSTIQLSCLYCDDIFLSTNSLKKYCSTEHLNISRKLMSKLHPVAKIKNLLESQVSVQQISDTYSVPKKIVESFINSNKILPFLGGQTGKVA